MSSEPVNELQVPANIPTSLDVEGAASKIAAYSIQDPKYPTIQIQSTKLRLRILQRAHIKVGSKVLEVGCGQGDSTAVLAVAVGESGKVVAVDPGPPDYGAPFTLGQAQAHLLQGPLGSRITFIQTTPIDHVQSLSDKEGYEYDYAIFSLCTFYFASPTLLRKTFKAISTKCKEIFVAEWSLTPSKSFPRESQPHIPTIFLRAAVDSRKLKPTSNCRTILSPKSLREMITGEEIGLQCAEEEVFDPPEDNLEGKWEVEMVLADKFAEEVQGIGSQMKSLEGKLGGSEGKLTEEEVSQAQEAKERGTTALMAVRDSIRANLPEKGVKGVKSMAIWGARFVPK